MSSSEKGEKTPLLGAQSDTGSVVTSERSVHFGSDVAPCASERAENSKKNDSASDIAPKFRRSPSNIYKRLTQSEREQALQRPGVGRAAFLIRDAVLGEVENPAQGSYDPYANLHDEFRNVVSIVCRRMCSMRPFRRFLKAIVWLLVFLSFFEPPSWCRSFQRVTVSGDDDDDGFTDNWHCKQILQRHGPPADDPESTDTVDYYPNFGTMFLTHYQALWIEMFCVTLITAFVLLRIGRDGMSIQRYLRKGPARSVRIIELVAILGLVCGMILSVPQILGHKRYLAPFFRITLLIAFSDDSRRELHVLFKLMPEVFYVLVLLMLVIIFWAWMGVVAFYDTEEGSMHFSDLVEAMWTLWICVTTANYPDVMMPAYNTKRMVTVYFVVFMIITFFFMMNVILASVVNAYDNELELRKQSREIMATRNLKQAFQLMTDRGKVRIDRDTVMALFLILNQDFPEFRTIPKDKAKLLFAILDKDGSSLISEEEFMEFGNVMLLDFDRTSSYASFVERNFPGLFRTKGYQAFSDAIRSKAFEYIIDVVLVLNAIVIAIQSYPLLAGHTVELDPRIANGQIDTPWEILETCFTVVYSLEILCKILVLGWKRFHESHKNMFDMTITVLSVLATAYVYYPNEFSDSRLIRFVVMARVLRLGRVLVAMRPFQVIAAIFIEILPTAKNVFLLLFCIMYFFAALGMMLFGGMISRDPADPLSYLLLNTDFSDNDYWANNFNDMASGLNVLFNLLVVNNWTECADGFEAVTESKYTRLFFLAFHIVGVILVNNLVIAFIVNSFIDQWDKQQEMLQREEVEGEAVIEGREALFDATYVTGTKTGLASEMFFARIGRLSHSRQGQQQMLKSMFTRSESNEVDKESFASAEA